ncbi:MAG TPA: hypothetical protein VK636_21300 [Gemmatimonadaceae bacterium]|nr:hypothetical protein [Gemmatimonadaceae bacterium]
MTFVIFLRAVARRFTVVTTVLSFAFVALAATSTTYVFSWPGTYDLLGTGFSNGARRAAMQFTQRDTTLSVMALSGPPGHAVSLRVVSDTAHIVWDLQDNEPPMFIELVGAGDSVVGIWTLGNESGPVSGRRRR